MTQPPASDPYFGNFDANAPENMGDGQGAFNQSSNIPIDTLGGATVGDRDYFKNVPVSLRPDPPSAQAAAAAGNATYNAMIRLSTAYDEYVLAHGGISSFKETDGTVYRITTEYGGDNNDELKEIKVKDETATRLLASSKAATADFKEYEKMFAKGGIFSAVATGSGGGGGGGSGGSMKMIDPADQLREEFNDFMNYSKGLYSLENEEQAWSMRADDQNAFNYKAVQEGEMPLYMANFYPGSRPRNERMSDILRPSVPDFVPSPYYDGGGMGGSAGFGEGLPVPGFAEGTGAGINEPPIDPNIAWMVGFNPLSGAPGTPFDPKSPYGQSLRGFPDRRAVQGAR